MTKTRLRYWLVAIACVQAAPDSHAVDAFGRPTPIQDFSQNAVEAIVLARKASELGERFRAKLDAARDEYFQKGTGEQQFASLLFQQDLAVFAMTVQGNAAAGALASGLLGSGLAKGPLFAKWVSGVRTSLGASDDRALIFPTDEALEKAMALPDNVARYNDYKTSRDRGEFSQYCQTKKDSMLPALARQCAGIAEQLERERRQAQEQQAKDNAAAAARFTRTSECLEQEYQWFCKQSFKDGKLKEAFLQRCAGGQNYDAQSAEKLRAEVLGRNRQAGAECDGAEVGDGKTRQEEVVQRLAATRARQQACERDYPTNALIQQRMTCLKNSASPGASSAPAPTQNTAPAPPGGVPPDPYARYCANITAQLEQVRTMPTRNADARQATLQKMYDARCTSQSGDRSQR